MSDENKFTAAVVAFWIFSVLLGVGFWGVVIYTAVHFIHKLW